jgi:hypothetical protein
LKRKPTLEQPKIAVAHMLDELASLSPSLKRSRNTTSGKVHLRLLFQTKELMYQQPWACVVEIILSISTKGRGDVVMQK